jgi:hypothetical protein
MNVRMHTQVLRAGADVAFCSALWALSCELRFGL